MNKNEFLVKDTSNGIRIYTKNHRFSMTFIAPMNNCKVNTISGINVLGYWRDKTEEEKKEGFQYLLKMYGYKAVFCTADKPAADFLRKNFNLIYCIKVPIGYSGKFQYHILIENTEKMKRTEYKDRLRKEGVRRLTTKLD